MNTKWFSLCTKITCTIIAFLFIGFYNIEANAYTGKTGYQVVVPSPGDPDYYILTDSSSDDDMLLYGFYELNGKVVFLSYNYLETVSIIDGFYASIDGSLTPYNTETKPIISIKTSML